MINNNRSSYFILIIITIVLGILSRKIDGIPTFFGDVLYAVMIYFGMRFLLLNYSKRKAQLFALLFCFCIELQQLYSANWILEIRRTSIGHYILGQGFLWSDIGFYTIGVLIAFSFDSFLVKTQNTNLK
jgi:Protein of unknown function (DUF2809)